MPRLWLRMSPCRHDAGAHEESNADPHLQFRRTERLPSFIHSNLPDPPVSTTARLRAARTSSGVDRISHLPDSLLREIVYRLPAKDAARTALLAARRRGVRRSPAAPAPARWRRHWRWQGGHGVGIPSSTSCAASTSGVRRRCADGDGLQQGNGGMARSGGATDSRGGGASAAGNGAGEGEGGDGGGALHTCAGDGDGGTRGEERRVDEGDGDGDGLLRRGEVHGDGVARFTATAWLGCARLRV
nr:uncharacterized protein LOC127328652 [Lolium perenne]